MGIEFQLQLSLMSVVFDSVSHTILLSKMDQIGIRGNSYHWFETYLYERSFSIDTKLQD